MIEKQTCVLPEWEKQSGVMLTWPHRESLWADMLDDINPVFTAVSKAVSDRQKVLITCYDAAHQHEIETILKNAQVNLNNVQFHVIPANDIWARDHGPLTAKDNQGKCLLDFTFNGWGEKYEHRLDNALNSELHANKAFGESRLIRVPLVLEGGSVEVDGHGTLMTTSQCLLSTKRNPHLSRAALEAELKTQLGVNRILWLNHGHLEGDDTDGHIDTLARFVNPHTIAYVTCDDINDSHYHDMKAMEAELKAFVDYEGNPYRLVPLPWPGAHYAKRDGHRLPATYANFLIINNAVLVPIYHVPQDEKAIEILSQCFPHHEMIAIPAVPLIQWHGSVHCMTMQLPEGMML